MPNSSAYVTTPDIAGVSSRSLHAMKFSFGTSVPELLYQRQFGNVCGALPQGVYQVMLASVAVLGGREGVFDHLAHRIVVALPFCPYRHGVPFVGSFALL